MTWTACRDCGHHFERPDNEAWRVRCTPCYKVFKKAETAAADSYWVDRALAAENKVAALQCQLYSERQTVEALLANQNAKPPSRIDRELAEHWRALVQLVHPDKHNGSPGATRLTQWLNDVKGRLPCA